MIRNCINKTQEKLLRYKGSAQNTRMLIDWSKPFDILIPLSVLVHIFATYRKAMPQVNSEKINMTLINIRIVYHEITALLEHA